MNSTSFWSKGNLTPTSLRKKMNSRRRKKKKRITWTQIIYILKFTRVYMIACKIVIGKV